MTRSLRATCENGIVTCEGKPVPSAIIFSRGVGPSAGVLYIDEENALYFPDATPDLNSTIESVISALDAASSGLSAAASGLSALAPIADPVTGPLAVATAVASLGSASGSISSAKTALNTLKGVLK